MKVRAYCQHLTRINYEELSSLPPDFNNTQSLSDDEILDILPWGTPRSWQNEMDRQGFDPMTKTVAEVVAFMENIEATEDRPENKPKANNKTEKAKKAKKTNNNNNNDKKPKYYCAEHGENWSHDTKDCKVLLNQGNNNNNKPHQNKTWTKKSGDSKKETAKELATLVGKVVDKTVKKHLGASSQKKRKSNSNDNEELSLIHI